MCVSRFKKSAGLKSAITEVIKMFEHQDIKE